MHVCVCATHHIIIDGHDQLRVITPDGYGREEFKFVRIEDTCAPSYGFLSHETLVNSHTNTNKHIKTHYYESFIIWHIT